MKQWPADRVERWPLERLTPYARNARTHSPAQVEQIAASMREWGWTNPILVDEAGGIIAGHGRVLAARAAGFAEAPVMVAVGWTEAQKRAYVLADNKLALNAGWDDELLKSELIALREAGVDPGLIGFSEDDLLELFGVLNPAEKDPDAAPGLPEVAISKPGDVWIMGPHRLAVGDSCDVGVYDALLGGELVDICWTDPPYNVAYEAKAGAIKNDDLSDSAFAEFLGGAFRAMWAGMKQGAAVYVAHADKVDELVSTVLRESRPKRSDLHPTMKPVALIERMLKHSARPGDLVLDPFGGSGSTLMAADRLGMCARLIELDTRYADVIVRRWQEYSGRRASLAADGRAFDVAA